ncbi:Receptor-like cytosolic serine/threonine-protein kinase RBK2, partial [Mucuna pruriens]
MTHWKPLFVSMGITDDLLYLHENCHKRIIHRDIKVEDILLIENFQNGYKNHELTIMYQNLKAHLEIINKGRALNHLQQSIVNQFNDRLLFCSSRIAARLFFPFRKRPDTDTTMSSPSHQAKERRQRCPGKG